jgi:hypothetical protein
VVRQRRAYGPEGERGSGVPRACSGGGRRESVASGLPQGSYLHPPSEARKMEEDMLIIGMRTSTPAQAVNKSISPESMFWSWIMIFVNFFSHMYHYTISRS